MKKVFAAILVAVLVAAIPATAFAAGSVCKTGILTPCRLMPPSGANGGKTQGSSAGSTSNRGGSSSSNTGSSQGSRGGALPPTGIR